MHRAAWGAGWAVDDRRGSDGGPEIYLRQGREARLRITGAGVRCAELGALFLGVCPAFGDFVCG